MGSRVFNHLHSLAGVYPLFDAAVIFAAQILPFVIVAAAIGYVILSKRLRAEKIAAGACALTALIAGRYVITALIRRMADLHAWTER